jgi:hypothetical protein
VVYFVGSDPQYVLLGDLNGDSKPEMVVINFSGPDDVSVLRNNGDGTFQSKVTYVGPNAATATLLDYDGDGNLDVAVPDPALPGVALFRGNGDGTLASHVSYVVQANPRAVVSADMDGDGIPDIVTANGQSQSISILSGTGNGLDAVPAYPMPMTPYEIVLKDFNSDGNLDVAAAHNLPNGPIMSVLLGAGGGAFQPATTYSGGKNARALTAGDFDNDGVFDLAVTNESSTGQNRVTVFLGQGDGTFQSGGNYAVGASPSSVTSGDFDADGIVDLAVANQSGNSVSVLLGEGGGAFALAVDYAAGTEPHDVQTADFNGDAVLDLAVTCTYYCGTRIILGNGAGTFSTYAGYAIGQNSKDLLAADFNYDGHTDLLAADDYGVSVLFNAADWGPVPIGGASQWNVTPTRAGGEVLAIDRRISRAVNVDAVAEGGTAPLVKVTQRTIPYVRIIARSVPTTDDIEMNSHWNI